MIELFDNFGHLASSGVPVQCPNRADAGAVTVIYVPITNVKKGDFLDISASVVFSDDPDNEPVVTGTLLWLTPASGVQGWSPTAQNAALHGTEWQTADINLIPAAGSGKYLPANRSLTIVAPFDMGDILALLSAYAGSDNKPGSISIFPSQTSIRAIVHRCDGGKIRNTWQYVPDTLVGLVRII